MDKKATVEELKTKVKKFCQDRDWDKFHNPKELAIGISTEANELLQTFRFKSEDEMRSLMGSERRAHVENELADVLYFVLRFAEMNDIDLSDSLERKLKINNEKYPVQKVKGCNKKYNEYK